MKYRQIATTFWEDGYTLELNDKEKVLFIYLFTNPKVNMVGIYELPDRLICATLGASLGDLKKMKAKLEKDKKFAFYNGWVFINNFPKYNRYSSAPPVIEAYLRDFNSIPQKVLNYFLVKLKLPYVPSLMGKGNTVIIRVMVMVKKGRPYARIQAKSIEPEKININEIPDFQ